MNDLISGKALLSEYDRQHEGEAGRARKLIAEAPAVDAVEVVRCYECKQSERMANPFGTVVHCHCWNKDVDYDGFCHEGY